MSDMHEGGCLCGHVRFRVTGPANSATNCHCRMCQKAAGAAFVTWAEFSKDNVEWLGAEPTCRASSDAAVRGFCPECGSAVTFEYKGADDIDIAIALFDDPNAFLPEDQLWTRSRVSWVTLEPHLPQFKTSREDD